MTDTALCETCHRHMEKDALTGEPYCLQCTIAAPLRPSRKSRPQPNPQEAPGWEEQEEPSLGPFALAVAVLVLTLLGLLITVL